MNSKQKTVKDQLAEDIEKFLEAGGKIQCIESGVVSVDYSKTSKEYQRRLGKKSLK